MNRKTVFIILGVSFVAVIIILVLYLKFKPNAVTSPAAKNQPTPAVVEETTTWTDPAQFNFQYPKSLAINPHNEDQVNYAHVELTSATHSGNLIVWVKDTTADNIDNWTGQEKIKGAIDTNLANIPAKKVLTGGDTSKLTISAIQGGYLYQVEASLTDNEFWNKALNTVVSTFKFTASDSGTAQNITSDTSSGQGADTVSSEEEVIE